VKGVSKSTKQSVLKELELIPGVGPKIAEDLWNLGLRAPRDLKNKDPEELYSWLYAREGVRVDHCVLYVFRCAVYYTSHEHHEPELLKWWSWKDANCAVRYPAKRSPSR
jgi:hypothetical protein